nr:unnamed protein product [Callosobruchus chinensis]
MTHLCPQRGLLERKCANCGGRHSANCSNGRFAARENLQVIVERRNVRYADAPKHATLTASSLNPSATRQNVYLSTLLRSLQHISSLIGATQALQAIFLTNG